MNMERGRFRTEDMQLFSEINPDLPDLIKGGDRIRYNGCTIAKVGSRGTLRLTTEMQQRHPIF